MVGKCIQFDILGFRVALMILTASWFLLTCQRSHSSIRLFSILLFWLPHVIRYAPTVASHCFLLVNLMIVTEQLSLFTSLHTLSFPFIFLLPIKIFCHQTWIWWIIINAITFQLPLGTLEPTCAPHTIIKSSFYRFLSSSWGGDFQHHHHQYWPPFVQIGIFKNACTPSVTYHRSFSLWSELLLLSSPFHFFTNCNCFDWTDA